MKQSRIMQIKAWQAQQWNRANGISYNDTTCKYQEAKDGMPSLGKLQYNVVRKYENKADKVKFSDKFNSYIRRMIKEFERERIAYLLWRLILGWLYRCNAFLQVSVWYVCINSFSPSCVLKLQHHEHISTKCIDKRLKKCLLTSSAGSCKKQ